VTVLLVEQDVSQALHVASRIHCLLEGRTTLEGAPAELTAEQIEGAYFGLRNGGNGAPGGGSGSGSTPGAAAVGPTDGAGSTGAGA